MTTDQIALVQDSFRLVAPIRQQAAAIFYGRLFETAPQLRPLFGNANMAEQGRKLMATLGFVVGALRQPETLLPAARGLAMRHAGYGVQEEHYAIVGAALLWTLEQALGEAFTPELRHAWASAYAVLSAAMIEAAQQPLAA
jgi:nitric oxide dioxygenase